MSHPGLHQPVSEKSACAVCTLYSVYSDTTRPMPLHVLTGDTHRGPRAVRTKNVAHERVHERTNAHAAICHYPPGCGSYERLLLRSGSIRPNGAVVAAWPDLRTEEAPGPGPSGTTSTSRSGQQQLARVPKKYMYEHVPIATREESVEPSRCLYVALLLSSLCLFLSLSDPHGGPATCCVNAYVRVTGSGSP